MTSSPSTGGAYDDKARLYALADPAVVASHLGQIQTAVLDVLQVAPSALHRVTISDSSAWFDYAAVGELWERKFPPALPGRAVALEIAESVLGKLERKCSDADKEWPELLRGVALLPPVGLLRRAGIHAVARPDGSSWDHWLYRAEPQLLLDGEARTRAGVFGAQVEVRIGHLGQVIGVRSRWRPLSGERRLADPVAFHAPHGGEKHDSEERPPIINFVLEGDGIPQYYLAPYYFQTDGHHVTVSSASSWSLTVDVGRTEQSASRMTLTALAQGGSGDYVYNWATYSLVDVGKGIRELGRGRVVSVDNEHGKAYGSSLQVDNGHYVVMLNVRDRETGAFKHHQQQVFSSAFGTGAPLVA